MTPTKPRSAWSLNPQVGDVEPPKDIDIKIPEAFATLIAIFVPGTEKTTMERLPRNRFYVAYGGRDSAKSWTFATALIIHSFYDPLRILCCREIQRTIADSVHKLLSDTIKRLGLTGYFDIQRNRIFNRCSGAEFVFAGLREQDAYKIKSFEGCDICWIEEAQTVTTRSWDMLIPTIRASKSEIWVTFNPDLDSDATYEQFVTSPPDDLAWIRKVSWRDNAFYSEVLDGHRRKMQRELPEEYDNIYEGNPRAAAQGAIYSREVTVLVQSGRFRDVPYDPSLPVHTAWDLGWNDQTTIIFLQRVASAVMIIDYEEASFLRPDEWAKVVNSKPYDYASHWMPHDAGLRTQPAGGVSFASQMKMMLKAVPRVAKRPENTEIPIRQARMMFPRVYIDKTNCARLLECLKRFKRGVPDSTGEPGAPVKDEYRHGADAFGLLALIVDKLSNDTEMPPIHFHTHRISNPRVGY